MSAGTVRLQDGVKHALDLEAADPEAAEPKTNTQDKVLQRPRVWFVDVVRLIASFQMINGHTLDVVMVDAVRHGAFYDRYVWARGLVSVAFLTVAGLAFHLATLARFDAHRASKSEVRTRFKRVGILFLLGYFLRFPADAFVGDATEAAAAWDLFFTCDVLQCIGVALFVLELTTVLARRPSQVVLISAVCAALAIGGAPFLHHVPLEGAWRPFTSYLTHAGGSLFPIFPWTGYMFAGCVLGWFTLPEGGSTPTRVAVPRLLGALALTALAWQGLGLLGPIGPTDIARSSEPTFSLERLTAIVGIVLVLAVVCAPMRGLPKLLRIVSAQSLFVYVFHLWVLYAGIFGIHAHFGRALTLPWAFAASASMMVLTISATVAWHRRRELLARLRLERRGLAPGGR